MSDQVERIRAKLMEIVAGGGANVDQARRILGKLPKRDAVGMARSEAGQAPVPGQPGNVDPDPSGMQSTGVAGSLLGLPYDPETQGVTGMHGETGDPLARDITTTALLSPVFKLGGAMMRGTANKLLGTEAGKLGELAAKGTRAPSAEALDAATTEAGSMGKTAMSDMLELQAQADEAAAVQAAREASRFAMPPISPFHPFRSGIDIARAAALPIGARMAPIARKVAESQASPLSTSAAALMFKRGMVPSE